MLRLMVRRQTEYGYNVKWLTSSSVSNIKRQVRFCGMKIYSKVSFRKFLTKMTRLHGACEGDGMLGIQDQQVNRSTDQWINRSTVSQCVIEWSHRIMECTDESFKILPDIVFKTVDQEAQPSGPCILNIALWEPS